MEMDQGPSDTERGHKIEDQLEHPFSVLLLRGVDWLSPVAHARGWTPNMVTSVSLVSGLIAVGCVLWSAPRLAALAYLFSYFCDCMDGPLARRYNQVTILGDLYDHGKDVTVIILLSAATEIRYGLGLCWLAFVPFALGAALHAGLIEAYNQNINRLDNGKNVLQYCRIVSYLLEDFRDDTSSKVKMRERMRWTRFAGDASLVLAFCAVLCLC